MGKEGPETRLVKAMRAAGRKRYGARLVTVKYHGSEYGEAGVSDLLCVLDGVFVAIEVKAPESYGGSVERALEKGPSIKQRAFVARVLRAGGVGGFAATIEQFMDLLIQAENKAMSCYDMGDQTGDEMAAKSKGMVPGAHPAAPGGMSQPQLVAELVRDTGLTKEQAESLTWPQQIEAVINSRAEIERRYKAATGKDAYDGADLSTFVADEAAGVYDQTDEDETFEDIWGTPESEADDAEDDDLSDLDGLLDDYDPVPSLVARGVMSEPEAYDESCKCGTSESQHDSVDPPHAFVAVGYYEREDDDDFADLDDDFADLDEFMDEVDAERAAYLEDNAPLFIGMPGVMDYSFAGHAGAGPSASERWMSCTASLEASRKFLETLNPKQAAEYAKANISARQGTTAHAAAEIEARLILGEVDQDEVDNTLLDLALSPPDGEEYTEEMGDFISEYVDLVRSYVDDGRDVAVECRVTALVPLTNGEVYEVSGSADFRALPTKTERDLVVGDLKYGDGIYVEVENNSQGRHYALGVLTELADDEGNLPDIETITYHIIQPRLGGIRTWSESLDDLLTWRDEVLSPALSLALAGVEGGATFNPSDKACQFCPAQGSCPALAEQRVSAAAEAFEAINDADLTGEAIDPATLDNETLGSLLNQVSGLVDLEKSLKEEAQRRLHRGEEVPGRHLVSYTPKREWAPEASEKLKRVKAIWKDPVLMTPTQALETLKSGHENAKALVEGYVVAPAKRPVISTGAKDRRAAWVGRDPESMFEIEEEE